MQEKGRFVIKIRSVQMMTGEAVKPSIFTLYIFSTCFSIAWTLYSGAWCPYQTEKMVPCRVRNGSEPYYGPNICWRNENGSYACTKKILYRPKYTTTFKKMIDTKYKCCPGRSGINCERECFNCTTYQKLEDRIGVVERRLSRLEYPKSSIDRSDRFHRDYMSQNSILYPQTLKDVSPETSALAVNLRLQKLFDEFRELQNKIRFIESEMSRLTRHVDDLALSNNIAYDYGGDRNLHKDRNNKDSPEDISRHNQVTRKSIPSSSSSSQERERHLEKTESPFRVLEENLERGDIASTLNDDYGDEAYNSDNSTEQYADQLQYN